MRIYLQRLVYDRRGCFNRASCKDERMVIKKNRLTPKDYAGEPVPRISIVTGIHGDELDGQYVCYEVIRRVNNNLERLKGIIDIYPDVNPLE